MMCSTGDKDLEYGIETMKIIANQGHNNRSGEVVGPRILLNHIALYLTLLAGL